VRCMNACCAAPQQPSAGTGLLHHARGSSGWVATLQAASHNTAPLALLLAAAAVWLCLTLPSLCSQIVWIVERLHKPLEQSCCWGWLL